MSDSKPSNTRETLIAELLGDVQVAIGQLERAIVAGQKLDGTLERNTNSLTTATEKYRQQVDDMAARLRVETAAMLTKTTEHAATALVGKQTAVLQDAATNAVRKAIQDGLGSRLRKYFAIAVIASGIISGAIVVVAERVMK